MAWHISTEAECDICEDLTTRKEYCFCGRCIDHIIRALKTGDTEEAIYILEHLRDYEKNDGDLYWNRWEDSTIYTKFITEKKPLEKLAERLNEETE